MTLSAWRVRFALIDFLKPSPTRGFHMKGVISHAMSLSESDLRYPTDLLLGLAALNKLNFGDAR